MTLTGTKRPFPPPTVEDAPVSRMVRRGASVPEVSKCMIKNPTGVIATLKKALDRLPGLSVGNTLQ